MQAQEVSNPTRAESTKGVPITRTLMLCQLLGNIFLETFADIFK